MTKRRDFLKNIGVGSMAMFYPVLPVDRKSKKERSVAKEQVAIGKDIDIEFLSEGEIFLGIGGVSIRKKTMRNSSRPMFVNITGPDGIKLTDFTIVKKEITQDKIVLTLKGKSINTGLMEWMLHTVRNRRNLSDWTDPVRNADDTELKLVILPVSRNIGEHKCVGFSYQYFYTSKTMPIYKILDLGSWEINGNCIGNHFWMRNGVTDCISEFKTPKDFYSTEWYLPGIANPNIFQFHPLQTQLQGFTFTSNDQGALITWPNKVSHVRSLFEKWRGKNDIIHFHEHCNDLSLEFETAPVEVLWYEAPMDFVSRVNLYNACRDTVHDELHRQIDMKRERITTYGVIEEWVEPDFSYYKEKGLSKFVDIGVKTVFICNQCQNAMNVWGVSNMCCNVDFKIADVVGEDKLTAFCNAAKTSGVRIEMWGNTALSTLTELFSHRDGKKKGVNFLPYEGSIMEVIDKAESPWVRNPSNAIEADHYTPRFCALNLRDKDIRSYWMKQWKHFHDNIGIEGIFLDSSFNMSSDKFHFRQGPEGTGWHGTNMDQKEDLGKYRPVVEPPKLIHTQYHAHLSWMVEMQKMGYHYCAEDMGVFGINRTGPDVTARISSLFMWQDCYGDFDEHAVRKAGFDPYTIFFKGLAFRSMWKVYWDINRDRLNLGIQDSRAYPLLKVFNEVEPHMFQPEILSDDQGVVYRHEGQMVLWCFKDLQHKLDAKMKVKNVVDGKISNATMIKGKQFQVYHMS